MAKNRGNGAKGRGKSSGKGNGTVKSNKSAQKRAKQSSTSGGGIGISNSVLALIAIGVIAVGGIIYIATSSGNVPQFPTFGNTNGTVPQALAEFRSSQSSMTTAELAALAESRMSNTSQFTVLYSGTLYAHPNGLLGIASVDSPLYVSDYKYESDRKFVVNASSVSAIGPVYISYINLTNGTFMCTNFNYSAVQNGQYQELLTGSHKMQCGISSGIFGLDFGPLSEFNFTQFGNMGIEFNYNTEYQSSYGNEPCTFLSGTVTSAWTTNSSGQFQMCISDVYYVPLSYSLYVSGSQGTFAVTLNETGMSNSSSLSYVTSISG